MPPLRRQRRHEEQGKRSEGDWVNGGGGEDKDESGRKREKRGYWVNGGGGESKDKGRRKRQK